MTVDEGYDHIITGFELFAGYTPFGARKLLEAGAIKQLQPQELLIKEGDEPTSVDLVLTGRLQVFVTRAGTDLALTTAGPGAILGELGVLCALPRSASVRAVEPSVVLQWSADAFRHMPLTDVLLSQRIFRQSLRTLIDNERAMIDALVKSQGSR
jgi:CRP-like cAMP-binding protein